MVQRLKVLRVLWSDASSGQKTVEFDLGEGRTVSCLVDGGEVVEGEVASIREFFCLDIEGDPFESNPNAEESVAQLSEWDVLALGRIVGSEGDSGLVDCGGIVISFSNLTDDPAAVGTWVGGVLRRLEAELEGPAA